MDDHLMDDQPPADQPADDRTGPSGGRTGVLVALAALLGVLVGVVVGATLTVRLLDDRSGDDRRAGTSDGPVLGVEGALAGGVTPIVGDVLASVVRIDVRGIGVGPSGEGGGASGSASGFVWDEAGHVVTNHHVVAGATGIVVTFADGRSVDAALVGTDPSTDLAVLHVGDHDLPPLAVADAPVQVGQLAVVVGSPLGLDGSVSAGIISATDRPVELRVPDGSTVRLAGVLQTDAGISPGSSGGPLVGPDGRLVGVVSALLGQEAGGPSVGFAVPADLVVDVVAQLIADGRVATPWLGLGGTAVSGAVADRLGVAGGVVVDVVADDSPAAVAGLQAGDVVVAADGDPVRSVDDLAAAVGRAGVGGTLALAVSRDGGEETVTVTPGERPDPQATGG